MKKFFHAAILGFFAPIAFIGGAESFAVHEGNPLRELLAGCLVMGAYLVICQCLVAKRGGRLRDNLGAMAGMITPLSLAFLLMLLVEKPPVILVQGIPMLLAGCMAVFAGALWAGALKTTQESGEGRLTAIGFPRLVLLVCCMLLAAAAVGVAVGVIPAMWSDPFPGATPGKAVPVFWGVVVVHILAAADLLFFFLRSAIHRGRSSAICSTLAPIAILLALSLAGPACGFWVHGPAMRAADNLLFGCAAADLLAGALLVISALRFPQGSPNGSGMVQEHP